MDDVARISLLLDQVGTMEGRPSNGEQKRWDKLYYDLRDAREAYFKACHEAQMRFQACGSH